MFFNELPAIFIDLVLTFAKDLCSDFFICVIYLVSKAIETFLEFIRFVSGVFEFETVLFQEQFHDHKGGPVVGIREGLHKDHVLQIISGSVQKIILRRFLDERFQSAGPDGIVFKSTIFSRCKSLQ